MISSYLNLLALHFYTVITYSELNGTLQRISSNLNLLALHQNTAITYSELNGTTLLCQHISNSNGMAKNQPKLDWNYLWS